MTKAKYIAKEYLEEKQVKETDEIVKEYEKLNDVGIKYTCYKLISSKLYLLAIYTRRGWQAERSFAAEKRACKYWTGN